MKLKRVTEMAWRFAALPLFIIGGPILGLCLGLFVWGTGVRITWSMRDSDYIWEE
jgi:hypothetical protein